MRLTAKSIRSYLKELPGLTFSPEMIAPIEINDLTNGAEICEQIEAELWSLT